MKTYTRFLLTASLLAIAGQSAWASQMEYKLTDANKRVCAEIVHSAELINTQQPTTTVDKLKKEAQLCPLSRRAQLRPLLYNLITILPLDLLQIIVSYDIHTLTGHEQRCLTVKPRTTVVTLENAKLENEKNENIFYSHSDDGSIYLWNAATGQEVKTNIPQDKKKLPREHPKLSRSDALVGQTVTLADGMLARENYPDILVIDPKSKTCVLSFATGLDRVSALCALADGRLVTGHERGAIRLWT